MRIIYFITASLFISVSTSGFNKSGEHFSSDNQLFANAAQLDDEKTNQKAPDFKLKLTDGKTIKLSDHKGKIVIVDFWATWCPPCRRSIPDLIDIQKTYKDKVVIIGISLDTETKEDVVPFMKKYGINYPVAYGSAEVVQSYGYVEAIPTAFIIDQKGNIAATHVGLVDKSVYVNKIEQLLKKP